MLGRPDLGSPSAPARRVLAADLLPPLALRLGPSAQISFSPTRAQARSQGLDLPRVGGVQRRRGSPRLGVGVGGSPSRLAPSPPSSAHRPVLLSFQRRPLASEPPLRGLNHVTGVCLAGERQTTLTRSLSGTSPVTCTHQVCPAHPIHPFLL